MEAHMIRCPQNAGDAQHHKFLLLRFHLNFSLEVVRKSRSLAWLFFSLIQTAAKVEREKKEDFDSSIGYVAWKAALIHAAIWISKEMAGNTPANISHLLQTEVQMKSQSLSLSALAQSLPFATCIRQSTWGDTEIFCVALFLEKPK